MQRRNLAKTLSATVLRFQCIHGQFRSYSKQGHRARACLRCVLSNRVARTSMKRLFSMDLNAHIVLPVGGHYIFISRHNHARIIIPMHYSRINPNHNMMTPEIKFTAFGIPYLVEFANVTFRSRSRLRELRDDTKSSTTFSAKLSTTSLIFGRRPSTSSSVRSASTETHATLATASSETLPCSDEKEDLGLYIQFASHDSACPPRKLSDSRLARLKYKIARAVTAAGMDSSPSTERSDPMGYLAVNRGSFGSIQSVDIAQHGVPNSLFRGTYGQVMAALKSAGLTATPCKVSGVEDATRLGALFVANHTECLLAWNI
ncbi:hypothetical protein A0H81_01557 [Grifola frondosa]|uniref:Uncharacterized protein n=1 Tax=Grifola frondosa TaxID=5627 RepID=A0A1C7MSW3_GRIFR|nr:hypothetical protein A0H81_01557 [Grifola frondosa]